ncbi:hypothetical protein F4778DRAFT_310686 [Xylariomycetidae sp. FL2044]|nr:hypothetical protein F4778DRAFT_310686 [Xylariomycetidae sp. FL2044]
MDNRVADFVDAQATGRIFNAGPRRAMGRAGLTISTGADMSPPSRAYCRAHPDSVLSAHLRRRPTMTAQAWQAELLSHGELSCLYRRPCDASRDQQLLLLGDEWMRVVSELAYYEVVYDQWLDSRGPGAIAQLQHLVMTLRNTLKDYLEGEPALVSSEEDDTTLQDFTAVSAISEARQVIAVLALHAFGPWLEFVGKEGHEPYFYAPRFAFDRAQGLILWASTDEWFGVAEPRVTLSFLFPSEAFRQRLRFVFRDDERRIEYWFRRFYGPDAVAPGQHPQQPLAQPASQDPHPADSEQVDSTSGSDPCEPEDPKLNDGRSSDSQDVGHDDDEPDVGADNSDSSGQGHRTSAPSGSAPFWNTAEGDAGSTSAPSDGDKNDKDDDDDEDDEDKETLPSWYLDDFTESGRWSSWEYGRLLGLAQLNMAGGQGAQAVAGASGQS